MASLCLYSSSSSFSFGIRQLLSLDTPRVLLQRRWNDMLKEDRKLPPFGNSKFVVKKEEKDPVPSCHPLLCALCTGNNLQLHTLSFSDPRREELLRSLLRGTLDEGKRGDLTFCTVCRSVVTRLFQLREEVVDIETRIRTVVKLQESKCEHMKLPSSSLELGLGQLMTLDSPRVLVGRMCVHVKKELLEIPLPKPQPVIFHTKLVKIEEDNNDPSFFQRCSLCTQKNGDTLSVVLSQDEYLRSLLGSCDVAFCPVCAHAVRTLITLTEKATDIETRIRAVVKLRSPQTQPPVSISPDIVKEGGIMLNRRRKKKIHNGRKLQIAANSSIRKEGRKMYRCSKCAKVITSRLNFLQHLTRFHDSKDPHNRSFCPICKKCFYSRYLFKVHSHPDKVDPSIVVYSCNLCNKGFDDRKKLSCHKRPVHQRRYKCTCPTCGKVCLAKDTLQRHKLTCSVPEEEQRKCRCGKDFPTLTERLEHERVVHKGLASSKCYFCSKVFYHGGALRVHMRLHTCERPFICPKCGKDFRDPTTFKNHIKLTCGLDEKTLEALKDRRERQKCRRKARLGVLRPLSPLPSKVQGNGRSQNVLKSKVHKGWKGDLASLPPIPTFTTEVGVTLYGCPLPRCFKKRNRKDAILTHLKKSHGLAVSGLKKCAICKKNFKSEDLYNCHTHPDPRNPKKIAYNCHQCGKSFGNGENLRTHQRQVHLKLNKCVCDICGKQFGSKVGLRGHQETCSVSQEQQRKCNCGKEFPSLTERLEHERVVHKGLASTRCYFCSKIQSTESVLENHLRVHTRETPFVCDKCGMGFGNSSNCNRHKRIVCADDQSKRKREERLVVSRERRRVSLAQLRHSCDLCDLKFGEPRQLRAHVKRMHP